MTKKSFLKKTKWVILFSLLLFEFSVNAQIINREAPNTGYFRGPTGSMIPIISEETETSMQCVVNGILISTSGSFGGTNYALPPLLQYRTCIPNASFTGSQGNWTGDNPSGNGIIVYTFSQPITSVRVSYQAVNYNDIGKITINAPGIVLSDPCRVNIIGTDVIDCNFPTGYVMLLLRFHLLHLLQQLL